MVRLLLLLLITLITACKSRDNWTWVEGNCNNGEGKKVYKDEGIEKGYWKNGKLNGQGYQFFGTTSEFAGDFYYGEFNDDKYDGEGVYYDKSEDSKYAGHWKNGKPDGKGIGIWGDKSKTPNRFYDGEWKDGKYDGYGTTCFGMDGKFTNDKYVGEWKNNEKNGNGKYYWANGNYYEGNWKNDLRDGDGIYVRKGKKKFKGHWEAGYCKELEKELGNE